MSHNSLLLVSVFAAVHIEGIVLMGISRTRIDKEYKFEVGDVTVMLTHTLMQTHTLLWFGLRCLVEVFF